MGRSAASPSFGPADARAADPCRRCPLERLSECRAVDAGTWRRFRHVRVLHEYRQGNIVFYQGNRPLGLHFICRGQVKLVKEDRFGHARIVRIARAPDFLGDRAFFAGRPYACSGEAMGDARVCFVEARQFWGLFGEDLEMFRRLTQRFARELGLAETRLHCLSWCAVAARTATHLLQYPAARPRGQAGGVQEIALQESRTELAQILGTTIEAVSRALGLFSKKGLIAVDGRRVRILDESRLRRAACPHYEPGAPDGV